MWVKSKTKLNKTLKTLGSNFQIKKKYILNQKGGSLQWRDRSIIFYEYLNTLFLWAKSSGSPRLSHHPWRCSRNEVPWSGRQGGDWSKSDTMILEVFSNLNDSMKMFCLCPASANTIFGLRLPKKTLLHTWHIFLVPKGPKVRHHQIKSYPWKLGGAGNKTAGEKGASGHTGFGHSKLHWAITSIYQKNRMKAAKRGILRCD